MPEGQAAGGGAAGADIAGTPTEFGIEWLNEAQLRELVGWLYLVEPYAVRFGVERLHRGDAL